MNVSVLSQKGGAGKSMLAQALAFYCAQQDIDVIIADMDTYQHTTLEWAKRRSEAGVEPVINAKSCEDPLEALALGDTCDVLIIDGTPFADRNTGVLASNSDWVIIPTGISVADLDPSLELAYELAAEGKIDPSRIILSVVKVPKGGDKEAMLTKRGIQDWGFLTPDSWLPMRTGYSQAMDAGLSVCETRFPALNEQAMRICFQIDELISNGEDDGTS